MGLAGWPSPSPLHPEIKISPQIYNTVGWLVITRRNAKGTQDSGEPRAGRRQNIVKVIIELPNVPQSLAGS
jgi:hypothetical protein